MAPVDAEEFGHVEETILQLLDTRFHMRTEWLLRNAILNHRGLDKTVAAVTYWQLVDKGLIRRAPLGVFYVPTEKR